MSKTGKPIASRDSFHSINVPSEWGQEAQERWKYVSIERRVSIQLMSPASGDNETERLTRKISEEEVVSIQLMSPASGDAKIN